MLRFTDVSYRYPSDSETTIDHLSFEVYKGEFVSIIGASGSGKTTLFKLINGLIFPQTGEITVRDIPVEKQKNYCGYMPQKDLLMPWRSVQDNLALPLELQRIPKTERQKRVDRVLEETELSSVRHKFPAELSGGMKQRVAFGRTILTGSDLFLLDEPFTALDFFTRLSMREWLLSQWQHYQKTILFITHDVEEAIFLSRKILVVKDVPIKSLQCIDVPLSYPRTRESLTRPEAIELREFLISLIKKQDYV